MISLYLNIEPATEWGGHEMSTVWHRRPEKRWLWLDLLFDVQDRNLLGHQTSTLGPKCKKIYMLLPYMLINTVLVLYSGKFVFHFFFCCILQGKGDTSGGCRCRVNNQACHPNCQNCHWGKHTNEHTRKNAQDDSSEDMQHPADAEAATLMCSFDLFHFYFSLIFNVHQCLATVSFCNGTVTTDINAMQKLSRLPAISYISAGYWASVWENKL